MTKVYKEMLDSVAVREERLPRGNSCKDTCKQEPGQTGHGLCEHGQHAHAKAVRAIEYTTEGHA